MKACSEHLHGRDIIVISPQYWGDMWVSKHWIASELSRHNRVLFVEPPVWAAGLIKQPSTIALGFPRLMKGLRRVRGNLFSYAPILWPRRFASSAKESLLRQVRHQVERLGFRDCIVLNFTTNPAYVHNLHDRTAVHYCVDPALPGPGEEEDEALICRRSDLVYAISETYRQQLALHDPGKPIHVIPHGIDFEGAQRVHNDPSIGPPPELARLGRPLLGFVGSVHDSYIDIELLELLSSERSDCQIALIGPYENNPIGANLSKGNLARIRRLANVHLLGPRPYHELARYVKFFDVGLVLIEIKKFDEKFQTRKRTLFKLLHYFSQGKPIIIPDLYEVESIPHLFYIARDRADFIGHVNSALHEGDEPKKMRVDYASEYSYDKILAKIASPIFAFESDDRRESSGAPATRKVLTLHEDE